MENPRHTHRVGGPLPPPLGAENVITTVAVDVPRAQTVTWPRVLGSGDDADRPDLRRIGTRPGEGRPLFGCEKQFFVSILVYATPIGAFIACLLNGCVFPLRLSRPARVAQPAGFCPREADHNQVRPTVAVEILGEA